MSLSSFGHAVFVFVTGYLLSGTAFRAEPVYRLFMIRGIPADALPLCRVTWVQARWECWIPLHPLAPTGRLFPFDVHLHYRGYVKTIPVSIEEAAYVDGAKFRDILFKIVMPMYARCSRLR